MKTKLKSILALLLCICTLCLLVACGEDTKDTKNPDDTPDCRHRDADDNLLCDNCGESYNDGVECTNHNYVDGVCSVCGEQQLSEGLKYTLNSDKISYSVHDIGDCIDNDIVIPSEYNGLPVTSIGSGAFYECTSLTSVVIPDSITSIGDYAFSSCDSLTSITVDADNQYYKSIDGNLYTKDGKTLIQYAIGKTATSFNIPTGVTSIGSSAFYSCDSLTSIEIPDSVTSIGSSAFSSCDSLTSIVIPDSVTSIGDRAFANCTSLTIYCEAQSQPSGWSSFWNFSNRPVVWGYVPEED